VTHSVVLKTFGFVSYHLFRMDWEWKCYADSDLIYRKYRPNTESGLGVQRCYVTRGEENQFYLVFKFGQNEDNLSTFPCFFFASSVKRSLSIFDCEMMRKNDKEKLILIVPRIYKKWSWRGSIKLLPNFLRNPPTSCVASSLDMDETFC